MIDYDIGSVAGGTYTDEMTMTRWSQSRRLRTGGNVRLWIICRITPEETDWLFPKQRRSFSLKHMKKNWVCTSVFEKTNGWNNQKKLKTNS